MITGTTTTTTTDIVQSDTLKQILTPESETVEPTDYHLKRIQAVEPLYHISNSKKNSSSSSSDPTLVPEASESSKQESPIEELEEEGECEIFCIKKISDIFFRSFEET